jgi:hypothetical protein
MAIDPNSVKHAHSAGKWAKDISENLIMLNEEMNQNDFDDIVSKVKSELEKTRQILDLI